MDAAEAALADANRLRKGEKEAKQHSLSHFRDR